VRRRCYAIPILIAVFCAAVCGKAWGAEGPVRLPRDLARELQDEIISRTGHQAMA